MINEDVQVQFSLIEKKIKWVQKMLGLTHEFTRNHLTADAISGAIFIIDSAAEELEIIRHSIK